MDYNKIKSISPDPVLESIVEFRFKASVPDDAIFGILYGKLSKDFPDKQNLPLLQMPEAIRNGDPNLAYKPLYILKGENNINLQLGPKVIAISRDISAPYMGWSSFSDTLKSALKHIEKSQIIEKVERTGVRYISFFENVNIFEKIKLLVSLNGNEKIAESNSSFVTEIKEKEIINRLKLDNSAVLNQAGKIRTGSIVDIDSYSTTEHTDCKKLFKLVEQCHQAEKFLFFSLLNDDFLKELKPEYGE